MAGIKRDEQRGKRSEPHVPIFLGWPCSTLCRGGPLEIQPYNQLALFLSPEHWGQGAKWVKGDEEALWNDARSGPGASFELGCPWRRQVGQRA